MTLWQNVLLFLPLNLVICLVASLPRRHDLKDVARHGFKMFLNLSAWIIGVSIAIHLLMEWLLGG